MIMPALVRQLARTPGSRSTRTRAAAMATRVNNRARGCAPLHDTQANGYATVLPQGKTACAAAGFRIFTQANRGMAGRFDRGRAGRIGARNRPSRDSAGECEESERRSFERASLNGNGERCCRQCAGWKHNAAGPQKETSGDGDVGDRHQRHDGPPPLPHGASACLGDKTFWTMTGIPLDAAHGFEHEHRHLRLGLIPRQRNARDRRADRRPGDVPGLSMVQRVRDYVILAMRAVAISRLHVPQAVEHFQNRFFDGVWHGYR